MALLQKIQHHLQALDYLVEILRETINSVLVIQVEDVRNALVEVVQEGDALMGTIAQEWLQQGLQQGLRQGFQQGRQEGEARGLRQGLLSGIRLALKLRFGLAGIALMPEIAQIEEVALLQAVEDGVELAATPEELRRLYQPA